MPSCVQPGSFLTLCCAQVVVSASCPRRTSAPFEMRPAGNRGGQGRTHMSCRTKTATVGGVTNVSARSSTIGRFCSTLYHGRSGEGRRATKAGNERAQRASLSFDSWTKRCRGATAPPWSAPAGSLLFQLGSVATPRSVRALLSSSFDRTATGVEAGAPSSLGDATTFAGCGSGVPDGPDPSSSTFISRANRNRRTDQVKAVFIHCR